MARDWSPVVLDTINSAADATTYDGNSVTLTNGRTYAISLLNAKATLPDAAVSIQTVGGAQSFTAKGTALLWDTIGTPLKRHRWWMLKCTATTTAVWRVDFGGNTQLGCRAVLWEIPDTTAAEPYVTEKQASVDTDTTLSCTPDALGSTNNLLLAAGFIDINNAGDTVSGTGWTGVGGGLGGNTPPMTLEAAYNEGGVAQQGTFSGAGSASRAIHIIEIAAPAVGANIAAKAMHYSRMRNG